jgi:hypothetical protein
MSDRVRGPRSVPEVPYRSPCEMKVFGDTVWCKACRRSWDTGDEPAFCVRKPRPPWKPDYENIAIFIGIAILLVLWLFGLYTIGTWFKP